jgi:plastocyanin
MGAGGARAPDAGGAALAGAVTGRVAWSGPLPARAPLEVIKDHEVCGEWVDSEALVVSPDTRGVRHAVIALEGVGGEPDQARAPVAAAPAAEVTLENRACRFVPHVLTLRVGGELVVVNADPVLHNLRGWLEPRRSVFNVVQPTQGQVSRRTIKRAGAIRLTCDTHVHMNGWLLTFDHPHFAVTDAEGRFTIPQVPPGRYRLTLWHEGWNIVRREPEGRPLYDAPRVLAREVTVPAGGTAAVDLELSE